MANWRSKCVGNQRDLMCKKDCDSDVIVVVLFMFYVWEEEQQKMVNRKCVMMNLDKMFVKCSPSVRQSIEIRE